MKKLLLIAIVFVIATYAYIAINEKQKERLLAKRVPTIKKVNKYEFSRALYQIRETRRASLLRNNTPNRMNVPERPAKEKEESNPAQPIENTRMQEDTYNQDTNQEEPAKYPVGIRLPKRFTPSEDQEQQDVNQEQQTQTQPQPTPTTTEEVPQQ